MDVINLLWTVLPPLAFTVLAVAGISDTYTRFTGGAKLGSKVMAIMPSFVALGYFVVMWVVGLLKWVPTFPGWKGWMIVAGSGVFFGILNNFAYDKFLYRIFAKDVSEKIAAGIAEKVTEKITGRIETVEVKPEENK